MLHKDQAICLRAVNYSETSQVVTLFSRAGGKISAIAKGSKRAKSAFEGPIEIFSFGDIMYSNTGSGKLATLTEFCQKPIFRGLRMRLFLLNCGLFAAELVDRFTEEADAHIELFDTLIAFLGDVQDAQSKQEALGLLILFQLTLLSDIGSRPVLDRCANCDAVFDSGWRQVNFSSAANGLVCYDCQQTFTDKIRISPNAAQILCDIRLIKEAAQADINEIEKVLIYHFTALMHRPPRMAKHFLRV
jgi:DNA repair protein RecO (recombination protein O)